MQITSH